MLSKIKVIRPEGMLDASKSAVFRQQIQEVIATGCNLVLVDLEKINFMDSSGLGALVLALKLLREKGGKLFLMSPNEQVKMLFDLTNTAHFFEIVKDKAELEAKLNG